MKLLVIVEQTESGYSAYSPDVPGCIATGDSRASVERTMQEAIDLHVDGLRADGLSTPRARAYATMVDVSVPDRGYEP